MMSAFTHHCVIDMEMTYGGHLRSPRLTDSRELRELEPVEVEPRLSPR